MLWFFSDLIFLEHYKNILFPIINEISRLLVFNIFIFVLAHIKKLNLKVQDLSRTDELTGLYNRRTFYEMARMNLKRAKRFFHPVTLVFIDIDDFKELNDNAGHLEGDKVLKIVGSVLKENSRDIDLPSRYGGDEFIIFMTTEIENDTESQILKAVEKIKCNVNKSFTEKNYDLTISIGAPSVNIEVT